MRAITNALVHQDELDLRISPRGVTEIISKTKCANPVITKIVYPVRVTCSRYKVTNIQAYDSARDI
jgi:hypothetical protein